MGEAKLVEAETGNQRYSASGAIGECFLCTGRACRRKPSGLAIQNAAPRPEPNLSSENDYAINEKKSEKSIRRGLEKLYVRQNRTSQNFLNEAQCSLVSASR